MATILEARELAKDFRHPWTMRRVTALERLDLRVEAGELLGLIGHNGAGKTTTLKLVMGLLRPTRGTVLLDGRPLDAAARRSIGFLPEQPYFYDYLTVDETLALFARLYGLDTAARRERIAAVVHQLGLERKRHARLCTLSKGTLQRVGVAQAILGRPRLLILDEPMSGLDPGGRHQMRELIRQVCRAGTTVVFSSHVLPDAEALCDRVAILARGRLREVVTLGDAGDPTGWLLAVRRVTAETLASLQQMAAAPPAHDGDVWRIRLADPDAVRRALAAVQRDDGQVESLVPVRPSLEERFLAWVEGPRATD
jgi:ABC-2 type transport system ATP-binding protein